MNKTQEVDKRGIQKLIDDLNARHANTKPRQCVKLFHGTLSFSEEDEGGNWHPVVTLNLYRLPPEAHRPLIEAVARMFFLTAGEGKS